MERHKKAREAGRVPEKRAKEFGKGVASGVKTAVKFAKDVKKVVSKEGYQRDPEQSKKDRTHSKQPDPSKDGFTGIGNMSIKDIMKMNAKIKAKEAAKKQKNEEVEVQEKVLDRFETGEKERIVKGMKKDTKGFKKRYGDKWKNVMYATATKRAKEAGDTSKSDKRYAVEGSAYGLWKGDGKRKLPGDKKKKEVKEDKAFKYVVDKLRKQHGKDAVITKDSPKPKPPSEAEKKKAAAERKKRQDADNKAYAARAKKAGFKSTQDYTNVVARYGSEDNYRKGKGLGT